MTRTFHFFVSFMMMALNAPDVMALSLFYTPQKLAQIEREISRNPQILLQRAKHLLHLSSILYFGPNQWVIWLQGERWMPETKKQNMEVLDVSEDSVRLRIKGKSEGEYQEITLRPHQSYNILTGTVSEGF